MSVINVKDSELESIKSANENIIVKFYADWCGACRLISPKFKKLSEKDEYSGVKFIEINAEENPIARDFAKVSTLPFFAAIKNGEILAADSFAKEELIVSYLEKLN